MKYTIVLATLLFMGCKSENEQTINTNEYETIDSLIGKSEQNLTVVDGANKKSDSIVAGKIEKTVKKIQKIESEIKELKVENKQLKVENNELKVKNNELKSENDEIKSGFNIDRNDDDNGQSYRIRAISDN